MIAGIHEVLKSTFRIVGEWKIGHCGRELVFPEKQLFQVKQLSEALRDTSIQRVAV